MDYKYSKSIDQGYIELKVYGGKTGSDIKVSRGDFGLRLQPLLGANASFETDHWKTRLTFATTEVVATRNAAVVIVKDPTASMMSAWLAKHFNTQVLFIMRHPCGFASSMDTLDWRLGVNGLLRQDALMRDHLQPYEELMQNAGGDKWLTRGAIWAAIHTVYARQQVDHPDWLLFKYEDICVDPFGQFDDMTSKTGLEMGEKTRRKIQVLSASSRSDPGSTQRNSKSMPDVWRQRMSPGEIDAVMGVVSEFGLDYY